MVLVRRMVLMGLRGHSRPGLLRSQRYRLRLRLNLRLLTLDHTRLAALVFAAAPAAPMPLRLPLAIGRGWHQFNLGLRQFCRHACTSWQFAIGCISPLDLVVFSPNAKIGAELSICQPLLRFWAETLAASEPFLRGYRSKPPRNLPGSKACLQFAIIPSTVAALPPATQELHRSLPWLS
jgi:hypothetical protein